jgi:predicted  nucleic acid-binding Zn-ribbon protein
MKTTSELKDYIKKLKAAYVNTNKDLMEANLIIEGLVDDIDGLQQRIAALEEELEASRINLTILIQLY